jgi:signal transduction histidine kinase
MTSSFAPFSRSSPNSDSNLRVREKVDIDNRFRLAVSIATLAVTYVLSTSLEPGRIWRIFALVAAYSLPYFVVWLTLRRWSSLNIIRAALSLADFVAITLAMFLTGGHSSPFFFLYSIPFLVHAFHFDVELIVIDGVFVVFCFAWIAYLVPPEIRQIGFRSFVVQILFAAVVIAAAFLTARRFRKKEATVTRSLNALQTTVQFLEDLNALPPTLALAEMQIKLTGLLSELLRPLGIFPRLWILNRSWKTLQGVGEHPALRPGSPNHLPTVACPAFALRKPFHYDQRQEQPCPSEQFNYWKHLCIPLLNETDTSGVLFLASYEPSAWKPEEAHLFEMLAHAIGMALHRKQLFEHLQEKVTELDFSFEVGATGLATFLGSTQSIDETTVNILDGVKSILKVDRASLMLWDAEQQHLQTQWVRGGDFKIQTPMQLQSGEGMAGWALQTGEPYWAEYAMTDPHYRASAQPIKSLLCVPVFTTDRMPLGVINAVSVRNPRVFTSREVDFLTWFGRQAALAIENAQLHHRNRANIERLKELNAMRSHFLSLVSHDLRGPLTGVRGLCEVLKMQKDGPLNINQLNLLMHLERQVGLQERMVDDLLDLVRMEKGQLSMHQEDLDIESLLQEEVQKSVIEADERGIALTYVRDASDKLPSVQADGGRIRQVIWNLIHNALKFTPEQGRVTVRAGTVLDGMITVAVQDTGVGLSADSRERIFDKFFQISPGGSRGAQGLGLGLAICKEIVLAHHGKIHADSAGLGLGTRITFTLPIAATAVDNLIANRAA